MKITFLNATGFIVLGILIGVFGTIIIFNAKFNQNIRKQVFDECFNYYSSVDKEYGIDATTIQTCKDKAKIF